MYNAGQFNITHGYGSLNVWILKPSVSSRWKGSPDSIYTKAWEYYSHSPAKPTPTPTNQLSVGNKAVLSTEKKKCVIYAVGTCHMCMLLTHEYPSLQHHRSGNCS